MLQREGSLEAMRNVLQRHSFGTASRALQHSALGLVLSAPGTTNSPHTFSPLSCALQLCPSTTVAATTRTSATITTAIMNDLEELHEAAIFFFLYLYAIRKYDFENVECLFDLFKCLGFYCCLYRVEEDWIYGEEGLGSSFVSYLTIEITLSCMHFFCVGAREYACL